MASDSRVRKKLREAERLRALSPQLTIEIGSELTAFGVELAEAAKRAQH